jgi:hypothetical protein
MPSRRTSGLPALLFALVQRQQRQIDRLAAEVAALTRAAKLR